MQAPHVSPLSHRQDAYVRLLTQIEAGRASCGVIGLGFIGSVLMDALIVGGYEPHGYDRDLTAVARFRSHCAAQYFASGAKAAVDSIEDVISECDVVFVAIRNPIENGTIDEEPLHAAAAILKQQTKRPRLIILESTVMPGTTRRFADEIADADDEGLFLAHAPERLSAGHDHAVLRATPRLVGGMDGFALTLGTAMLKRLCDEVVQVSSPEVSELSKLLENAFLSVNIGLTNEVTRVALSLGIRAQEVCRAAATKPHGFVPFHPGAGVGGHCLPNDLRMLAEVSKSCGWNPELLCGAISANDGAPSVVVKRLENLLSDARKSLAGSSVLIVGVGFKPGSPDITRSPAYDVTRLLRLRAASPHYCDSLVKTFSVDGVIVPNIAAVDLSEHHFTASIILSGDAALSDKTLLEASAIVLDAGGSRIHHAHVEGIETL